MKRVIAFEHEAEKKTLEVFREKKRKREREREGNARGLREKCIDTARSRASKVLLSLLLSSSSPNPLSSLSLLRALPRRKENPLKRFTHSITKKKKYSPRWHERIIHASAVRPGRLRVHVVVEIETLLVRRFHAGHSRRHLFLNLLLYKLSLTGDTRSIDIIFSDDFKFWRYASFHKEKKNCFLQENFPAIRNQIFESAQKRGRKRERE